MLQPWQLVSVTIRGGCWGVETSRNNLQLVMRSEEAISTNRERNLQAN